MTIYPLRDLGSLGIISDIDPFELPFGAFSSGVNARCIDSKITHAPVFRDVDTLSDASPRHIAVNTPSGGNFDNVYIGYKSGRVSSWADGVETDVSISGYSNSDSEAIYTDCALGTVQYINREDHVPWALLPSAAAFVPLANWNSSWRCKVLRAYNGALIALNVTKSGVTSPNMVKTSDIVGDIATVPTTWDETDTTNNATENLLADMVGPITDGNKLGNNFIIYGPAESWLMVADQSNNVYQTRRLPFDKGAISANCSVEVGGKHFVFGATDIWTHDGNSEVSIADKRVLKFIFGAMNVREASRCFVAHNPNLKEIAFCFVSGDPLIGFTTTTGGCNRAAVYRYSDNTWWFDDLPLVYSCCYANTDTSATWSTATGTWETTGGSWLDQDDGFKKTPIFVGETSASNGLTSSMYAWDVYGSGSVSSSPVNAVASRPMLLSRSGLDLDELQENFRGYKNILSIYPIGYIGSDAEMLEFQFGGSDYSHQQPVLSDWMTFDGLELYKLDFKTSGRWLTLNIRFNDYKDFVLTGLDADIVMTGRR